MMVIEVLILGSISTVIMKSQFPEVDILPSVGPTTDNTGFEVSGIAFQVCPIGHGSIFNLSYRFRIPDDHIRMQKPYGVSRGLVDTIIKSLVVGSHIIGLKIILRFSEKDQFLGGIFLPDMIQKFIRAVHGWSKCINDLVNLRKDRHDGIADKIHFVFNRSNYADLHAMASILSERRFTLTLSLFLFHRSLL